MAHMVVKEAQECFEGETYESATRLVVAPVSGSFEPSVAIGGQGASSSVLQGQVIGHITNTSDCVAVVSQFAGHVDAVLAWPNERLQKHQKVLALRVAS